LLSEKDSAKIVEGLLAAVTSEEVQAVLHDKKHSYYFEDPQNWSNYGNREKNWDTRMHPDQPAPTITTRCNSISNGRFGHYDVRQNRGVTPREAAALQSFPDDFIFYPREETDAAARLIGNAVPPRLAKFFATHIKRLFQSEPVLEIGNLDRLKLRRAA
jgi:site-specific DNA-cytosine methylase